jgi:glycosyltransferase involved in cell wall biosynthesis
MKKLLIVNNNMKVGGVQKSLLNLLWSLEGQYEVTLCLFSHQGAYLQQLPPWVKVVSCRGFARYLGISQGQCRGADKLLRGGLAVLCRMFGRDRVMKLVLAFEKPLPGEYDCAIAFLHNGSIRNFYGGVQEFVLKKTRADRKVAWLHCDYGSCGANHPRNNRIIAKFDCIAACSDGCRRAFAAVVPELTDRCVTVPNFHCYRQIADLAKEPASYAPGGIHCVSVARLAHEKALDRGILAVAEARKSGADLWLHIVGGGPMEPQLRQLSAALSLEDRVVFHGEQPNPYPYMAAADLFLLTSYHEAAPMVIDEAVSLGLPVLTVRTTSSREMVTARGAGWVCDNDQAALNKTLLAVVSDAGELENVKNSLRKRTMDNTIAAEAFRRLIGE